MNFPKHKCGLYLTHNEHKDRYQNVKQFIDDHQIRDEFKDKNAIDRAIAADEIWSLQWYPNTPVGFIKVSAPTFEEVISLALEIESK
jgi:hypothetical protein